MYKIHFFLNFSSILSKNGSRFLQCSRCVNFCMIKITKGNSLEIKCRHIGNSKDFPFEKPMGHVCQSKRISSATQDT